ncbi:DNA mismatch repair protein MutS [Chryseobacterium sp. RR2-3-20]|uniref:MutS-related protein n=1 Tax=Chryseobacterium sp. RR2-3-20 TaxID=2787626 RepID=UPI001ADFE76D|nr:DNA mismatch repair protein MutS [Chryseobacterium sp. RR2-3-20]
MDYDLNLLKKYFDFVRDNENFHSLPNETAEDLELDLVFLKLDNTASKIGKQYFFAKLRSSDNNSQEFESFAEFFKNNPKEKEFALKQLSQLNNRKDYDIIDLLKEGVSSNEKYYKYAQFYLFAITLIAICGFFVPKILLLIIPLIAVNMVIHYLNKNYVDYYNSIIFRLQSAITVSEKIGRISKLQEEYDKINLKRIKKVMRFANLESAIVTNEYLSVLWIFTEIFRILFLLEIFSFRKKVNALEVSRKELLKMFEFIGKTDTSINLLKIQEDYNICKPIFVEEKKLRLTNIYHPFIENCVQNSLELQNESIAITGSNMSGKTSFMRSVAINVVFAQNFGFCFADFYSGPKMKIYSSISVHDDISENKSYYLEEVLRIKKFLEDRNQFALILIDEIFKGTNTKERIAISKSVLQNLNNEKNIVFVTTHDLEIAMFLKDNNYELFYFDEEVNNNQLSFPYKLKNGINEKTNAIRILEMYDYPKNIVENAKNLVEKNGYR